MKPNYKVQRSVRHIVKEFPETVKSFGVFIATTSATALTYGIITSPFITNMPQELLTRDSAGNILAVFGGMSVLMAIDTIKNFKLEKKQKKLQSKLNKEQEHQNAQDDFMELYNRIESSKRFEEIQKQTRNI